MTSAFGSIFKLSGSHTCTITDTDMLEFTCMSVAQSCQSLCDPWTVARQAPLSMEFSRQEYWSGLPIPSPRDLPHPGIEPGSPALLADSLPSEPPRKPHATLYLLVNLTVDLEFISLTALLLFKDTNRSTSGQCSWVNTWECTGPESGTSFGDQCSFCLQSVLNNLVRILSEIMGWLHPFYRKESTLSLPLCSPSSLPPPQGSFGNVRGRVSGIKLIARATGISWAEPCC